MIAQVMEKPKGDDSFILFSVDRISELPQPILHHILSFLSQSQAVKTCVLSKSWRHLWCGRPILEFRRKFFRRGKETIEKILEQTLERYCHQNLSIKEFVVEISSIEHAEKLTLLDKWIPKVLMNRGVETFRLMLPNFHHYTLPWTCLIFQAELLKELYLMGCKIESTDDKLCLKHLKTLSLNRVYIEDDKTLEKMMESCPLIERLELVRCEGLTNVMVNNNLKHFVYLESSCNFLINVPSALETIQVTSCLWCPYHIDNYDFPHLKSLCLHDVQLPEELSDIFLCNSPCLEDLELKNCSGFNNVRILSRSVKRLSIKSMNEKIKTIGVNAPGILYFEFSCCFSLPSIYFAKVASREWKSNIDMPFELESFNIYLLNEVLRTFRQSRITLTLTCDTRRSQHFVDINHVGFYVPVVVEHLNLKGLDSDDDDDDFAALFNCLFRIFRPRYIYPLMYPYPKPQILQHYKVNSVAKFVWKANLEDGEFSQCYFWQQELKEFRCEILAQGQWLTVYKLIEIPEKTNFRFVFEWREATALLGWVDN